MELSENSIKLINILCSDTEKLNKFVSLFKSEDAFRYCVSLIPEYTREEFESMKTTLTSKKEILSDETTEKISGGSFYSTLDNLSDTLSGYSEGQDAVEPVTDAMNSLVLFINSLRNL